MPPRLWHGLQLCTSARITGGKPCSTHVLLLLHGAQRLRRVEFIFWPHRKKQEVVIYHTSWKRQNQTKRMERWCSKPKSNTYLLCSFIIIIIITIIIYFNHLFFQTHGVKLQMPYKMHTLWNSCIAGNKEPNANPTATLTAGLPFIGARKIPYLNINRVHPPSRGVLWQHIYILFRRKKKAFSWGQTAKITGFASINLRQCYLDLRKWKKKKKRSIYLNWFSHP